MTTRVFTEPDIKSSFLENNLGESIYAAILLYKPTYVIELGALGGYSSLCILQALTHLGEASTLITYDLFEKYPHNCVSMSEYCSNVRAHLHLYDLSIVDHQIVQADILQSANTIFSGNSISQSQKVLVFIDISNTAENLSFLFRSNLNNYPIIFEGGTTERDNVEWMLKYSKAPISSLKNKGYSFSVLNHKYPSLSLYHPAYHNAIYP